MTEAILIFTFSPVQPFIAEARRAGDLYAGSYILSELAKAAARALGPEKLIYPDQASLGHDVPNKLVAKIPYNQAEALAERAEAKLRERWQEFVKEAHDKLAWFQPTPDSTWLEIWLRQTNTYWECYWAFAPYTEPNYRSAYLTASHALDAAKRTRHFTQCAEDGLKDTLSGQRSALRVQGMDAREYWSAVAQSPKVTAAELRPEGKERLDAIGAVKRFGLRAEKTLLSVSSIAAADFLEEAKQRAGMKLAEYRQAIESLLPKDKLYQQRPQDKTWPYDGDLFFAETLLNRLEDSYNVSQPDSDRWKKAQTGLEKLWKEVGWQPTPYYALLLMDGDGIGERVDEAAKEGEQSHRLFSQTLSQFAGDVSEIVNRYWGQPIYSGGDDVFALAPLSKAIALGQVLQADFGEKVGGTTSAGIAIAHHLYPLSAALQAAREAEQAAKQIGGKAAVVVRVLKRSGETLEVRSKWQDIPPYWETLIGYFQKENGPLSSRFAYSVAAEARIVTDLAENARKASLRRLVERHKTEALLPDEAIAIEDQLAGWAAKLDKYIPEKEGNDQKVPQGLAEVGYWLLLAHFIGQRGGD